MLLVQKEKTVFAFKRFFHCRASLAVSRVSTSKAAGSAGEPVLRHVAIAGRPDVLRRHLQRVRNHLLAFRPVAVQRVCQRGGRQPRLAGERRQRGAALSQGGDNVSRMPVRLRHAITSSINFTPSVVRIQRGALISAAKYSTSSDNSQLSCSSSCGGNVRHNKTCASV